MSDMIQDFIKKNELREKKREKYVRRFRDLIFTDGSKFDTCPFHIRTFLERHDLAFHYIADIKNDDPMYKPTHTSVFGDVLEREKDLIYVCSEENCPYARRLPSKNQIDKFFD